MKKLITEEMIYLEDNLYNDEINKYFLLGDAAYEYIERAIKLPYEETINLIESYSSKDTMKKQALFVRNVSKRYNLSNKDVLKRLNEVNRIKLHKEKIYKLELKKYSL